MGCGAHLKALRRTGIARLRIEEAVTLDRLTEFSSAERIGWVRPVDLLLSELPAVILDTVRAEALLQGRQVIVVDRLPDGPVRVYAENGIFLGLGTGGEQGRLSPRRMRANRLTAPVASDAA